MVLKKTEAPNNSTLGGKKKGQPASLWIGDELRFRFN